MSDGTVSYSASQKTEAKQCLSREIHLRLSYMRDILTLH